MASRTGGHLRLFSTELTQGLQHHRLGFGGKGGETDMLFFGWAWKSRRDPSCLRHWPGAWGFGGRRRKSGCCLWCGLGWSWEGCFPLLVSVWGGVSGASLFFPPFPFSLIRFGPWDKTLHSTHTHNGWDCKRSGIRRWAAWIGMLGVVGFLFGRGWSGLVWSGSSFSFGTVTLILYTSHHHMTAHRHYTALHPPH